MKLSPKKLKLFERLTRGAAHQYRIKTLFLLKQHGNLSVGSISELLRTSYKNTSQHLQKMTLSALIFKTKCGNETMHSIAPFGKVFLAFYNSIEL